MPLMDQNTPINETPADPPAPPLPDPPPEPLEPPGSLEPPAPPAVVRPSGSGRSRRRWRRLLASRRLWILPILLAALWIRLAGLNKSIWEDEAHSLLLAAQTPYRHALLLNLSVLAFKAGHGLIACGSLALMRLPFLAAGLLAVWMGWLLGRVRRDWLLGFLLALALALWPNKAFLDTMARDYPIGIFTSLAALVAWEAYRVRPSTPRLGLALLAMVYAVLSLDLNVLWLSAPVFYLGWEWVREAFGLLRPRLLRSRPGPAVPPTGGAAPAAAPRRPARPLWRLLARLTLQTALAAWVLVYTADLKMGPGFSGRSLQKAGAMLWGAPGGPHQPVAAGLPKPAGPPPVAAPQPAPGALVAAPREPGLPEFFRYLGRMEALAFRGPELYPPAIFGMTNPRQITLTHLIFSPVQGRLDHQETVYKWLLLGLILGSLLMLFESPPLALTAWLFILGTGFAVFATGHNTEDRYFVNSGLFLLLVLVLLAARLLRLGRGLLLRRRPRWNAAVTLALALALGVGGLIAAAPDARHAARYAYQDWQEIYDQADQSYPGGVLFVGIGPQSLQITDAIAANHHDLWHPADFWHSPRRNLFVDASKDRGYLDLFLLDQLNALEGMVIYKPTYWELDYKPFTQYPDLFQFTEFFNMTCAARLAGLGHRVFVTRGGAALPLLPRLLETAATGPRQGRVYRMQCYFEVPGDYELTVGEAPDCHLLAAAADGTTLTLATRPATPGTTATLARRPAWQPVAGHEPPLALHPARESAALLVSPPLPFTTCTVTLVFDNPPGARVPLLALTRRPPERRFERVTSSYDVGPIAYWQVGPGLTFGMPLQIRRLVDSTTTLSVRGYLFDMQSRQEVGRSETFIRPNRKTLAPGDLMWLGSFNLNEGTVRTLLNRNLLLSILPLYQDPLKEGLLDPEPILNTKMIDKTINQYVACYLRIVAANGKLALRIAYPKD